MDNLESTLAAHPFLAGVSSLHLQLLTDCATLVNFRANHVIFAEGEEARQLFLLRYGRVAVEIHRPRRGHKTVYTLGEGDVLGLSWLELPQQFFFDARAVEITRAIALDLACLQRLSEDHPDLEYELLKRFVQAQAKKLKLLKLQLVDFYGS